MSSGVQRSTPVVDAVVIGAGPNGLVAAIALADAGWDVVVVEAEREVGGAVRSTELFPGYVTDLFSAFYPLAAGSPVIRQLELDKHGLVWCQPKSPVAHVVSPGSSAYLWRDLDATAEGLETSAAGDGDVWRQLYTAYRRVRTPLLDALFTPFPPVRAGLAFARRSSLGLATDLARIAVTPAYRLGIEWFQGDAGRALLSGNAMHSDLGASRAGGGFMGWLLSMLAQDVGFPVPRGGSGRLASALRSRAEAAGARILCGAAASRIGVVTGRATSVQLLDGTAFTARRAVLADVSAPALYETLLGPRVTPPRILGDLRNFAWDHSTIKLNWALDRPIPWLDPRLADTGTVHLSGSSAAVMRGGLRLEGGELPGQPFVVLGQMARVDPTRAPSGCESAWAYTHVPQAFARDEHAVDLVAQRVRDTVEAAAPGFARTVVAEHVQRPADLEAADRNLVGGAINGGTSALHQQLIFRPTLGLGRPETPIPGLYLASASAHPGGGVHGACGWNAARAALSAHGSFGAIQRLLTETVWERLLHGS
ncbi:NAD(P)/FAD-dependent oxidoreductase [Flexivirga sp. ID2601S]|uniref:Pyridine nucleotide-disulfide oxidoreductase domain-containing protein 2 n=1 Tax=Flexivirga aerilata TaxID=1656889 RepID=A0A849ARZ1_9MICO|nr:NAD(P)/FAD-dependent oxidoreductase [Flexivirga aerilata]NNG41050.1 NAD(P)/FAD-dependent oxidoreductase [Flexivirga aerilata]